MNNDSIKNQTDDAKTAAEHEFIILKYQKTRYLDREDAIKKYKDFNTNHPEYYLPMRTNTISKGTAVLIDEVSNDTIVDNLNQQLRYLISKNLLEDMKNG